MKRPAKTILFLLPPAMAAAQSAAFTLDVYSHVLPHKVEALLNGKKQK